MALGSAFLVVACCALGPLLAAGGAITGIGALLHNPWAIAGGVGLLILAALASTIAVIRNRRRHHTNDPDCCPPTQNTEGNADAQDDRSPRS